MSRDRDEPGALRRRTLLTSAVAAASGVALMPAWIRNAFAQDAPDPSTTPSGNAQWPPVYDPGSEVLAAYRRARRLGKPLLAIVVPDERTRWERGRLWGELLNNADDLTLAHLALVEVVCAEMRGIRAVVPSITDADPIAVLIDTHRFPARPSVIDPALPDVVDRGAFDTEDGADAVERSIDARIRHLSDALIEHIGPTSERYDELAMQAERRVAAADREHLAEAFASGASIPPALADRGAAIVMRQRIVSAVQPENARVLESALAAAARVRLVSSPPAGAATRWSRAEPCGESDPEMTDADRAEQRRRESARLADEERARREGRLVRDRLAIRLGWACGMGFVPERSARFLDFYARVRVDDPVASGRTVPSG